MDEKEMDLILESGNLNIMEEQKQQEQETPSDPLIAPVEEFEVVVGRPTAQFRASWSMNQYRMKENGYYLVMCGGLQLALRKRPTRDH